jgi:hypothetical protein
VLRSPAARRRLATYLPPLLVALLALPFVLRQNSWWEWGNAYWLLERQTAHVSAHGLPTLFVHTDGGPFNPVYVFYGGPLFSVLAYPAAIVGPWTVFAVATVAALVANYLGIWWTARNLGLSRPLAILPALTFTTTPYVLSNLYGRGAWSELVAVSAVAVLSAALTSLMFQPERQRSTALLATVLATATITGTHNLTALMCALVLPFVVLALWLMAPRPANGRHAIAPLAWIAGAVALGAGLTAAWLLPNLWYSHDTVAASSSINDVPLTHTGQALDLSNLLSIWPKTPPGAPTTWLFVQAPALATAWSLVALAPIFGRPSRTPAQMLAGLATLVATGLALFVLIADGAWWLHFPSLFKTIQFPYRLVTYFSIVVCLGMVFGLGTSRHGRAGRLMIGALVLAIGIQLAAAEWTVWSSEPAGIFGKGTKVDNVRASQPPASFGGLSESQFRTRKHGDHVTLPLARLKLDHRTVADSGNLSGTAQVGDLQLTKLIWSRMVRVTGDARIVGHDDGGQAYVSVTHTDARGHWTGRIENAHPWPLAAGRIISLLSGALIAALGLGARRRRRRRGVRATVVASASAAVAGPPREPAPAG